MNQAVPIMDLLEEEADLTPARYQKRRTGAYSAQEHSRLRDDVARELAELTRDLPQLQAATSQRVGLPMSVAALLGAGSITLHQAPIRMATTSGDLPVLTAKDLIAGRSPTSATTEQPGLITVEANDVVLPIGSRGAEVFVIETGGLILGPQLLLLRPDSDRVDPHFLAGFLRIARLEASGRSRGSHRFDLHAAELPDLPLPAQKAYGEVFRQLRAFQDRLRHVTELTDLLAGSALTGIGTRHLVPRGR